MASRPHKIGGSKAPRRRALMAQPVKHKVSGIYYFRRKVPKDLRHIMGIGHEYKKSLGTRDLAEAKRLFAVQLVQSDRMFSAARSQLAGVPDLTVPDIHAVADAWYQAELAIAEQTGRFDQWLADGSSTAWEAGDRCEEHRELISLREADAVYPEEDIADHALKFAQAAIRTHDRLMPQCGTPMHDALTSVFTAKLLALSDIALKRHEGDWNTSGLLPSGEPKDLKLRAPVAPKQEQGKKLGDVFKEYAADRVLTDGEGRAVQMSNATFGASVAEFIDLCSDHPVSEIKREHARHFRAQIARLPAKGAGMRKLSALQKIAKGQEQNLPKIGPGTIRNKVAAVSAVLGYALQMQYVSENVVTAGGTRRDASKAAARGASSNRTRTYYNSDELAAIFGSPIYTKEGWLPSRADFGAAWFWIPLLMYYTGARREELAQLAVRDVKRDAEVGPYLGILNSDDDSDQGRSVKTPGSRRSIPLHPDLVKLGFLDYAATQPLGGQLFPKLVSNPNGYFGANFGKRWAEYLRNVVGLDSPAKPAHGFRHTFKTLCRTANIPEDVNDALTGHSGGDAVARGYGTMPLASMAEHIKRLPSAPLPCFTAPV